jgi:hypothetical protein
LGDWPGAEVRAAEAAQVASRQGAAELLTRVRATQARVASRAAGEAQSRP